jgi:hypothetical protein
MVLGRFRPKRYCIHTKCQHVLYDFVRRCSYRAEISDVLSAVISYATKSRSCRTESGIFHSATVRIFSRSVAAPSFDMIQPKKRTDSWITTHLLDLIFRYVRSRRSRTWSSLYKCSSVTRLYMTTSSR